MAYLLSCVLHFAAMPKDAWRQLEGLSKWIKPGESF
jgi:hypothetical protein